MTANGAAAAVGTLLTILVNQESSGWDHLPPEVQRTDRERIEQMRGAR